MKFPGKLQAKLDERSAKNALRSLPGPTGKEDFSSNDYLGFARSEAIFQATHRLLTERNLLQNGATGSRLLSGNHTLYEEAEQHLTGFHRSEAALIFNSGYDANIGFFSAVPQRGDIIFYDEYIHASIRDGIGMSHARGYKFLHNNPEDLRKALQRVQLLPDSQKKDIYIVTESVFSMDGDAPDLEHMAALALEYNAFLVVDEAHALGIFGRQGCGRVQHLGLENEVFARIVTFGKALGCHGAAILGSLALRDYLVNFARSFIYTTALPPPGVAAILAAYQHLKKETTAVKQLKDNIGLFKLTLKKAGLERLFIPSDSAIHCCMLPGNDRVKRVAEQVRQSGFDVKPILSPTVPADKERLRFCLHSYNTPKAIEEVIDLLRTFVA